MGRAIRWVYLGALRRTASSRSTAVPATRSPSCSSSGAAGDAGSGNGGTDSTGNGGSSGTANGGDGGSEGEGGNPDLVVQAACDWECCCAATPASARFV